MSQSYSQAMTFNSKKPTGFTLLSLINSAYKNGEVPIAFFVREDSYNFLLDLLGETHSMLLGIPDGKPDELTIIEFNDVPIIPDDKVFKETSCSDKVSLLLKTLPGISGLTLKDVLEK